MDIIKKHFKLILIFIIFGVLVFWMGYLFGTWVTIKAVVQIGKGFVHIDENLVNEAINQYKYHLASCYPPIA